MNEDMIRTTDANSPFPEAGADDIRPWEMIETGRYRPRRIRGSYRGRELG